MRLARRLYLYVISAISITVLAVALTNLLELLFTLIQDALVSDGFVRSDPDEVRRTLSMHVALIVVALPIWLLHWWLVERDAAKRDELGDAERRSDLRALYIIAGLGIPFIVWAINGINLLQRGFDWLFNAERSYYGSGVTTWLALTIVAGGIWGYHAWLRVRDTRMTIMSESSDWLPRFYRYVAATVGALLVIIGTAQILALALDALIGERQLLTAGRWWAPGMADALGRSIGGLVIWGLHWGYSLRLARLGDWRGSAERYSTLRLIYLYLIAIVAVFASLVLISIAFQTLFREILDVSANSAPLAYRLLEPIVYTIPFLLFWYYHRAFVLDESREQVENASQATLRRIYTYAIAFVGPGVAAVGLAGTLQVALGLALDRGNQIAPADPWRNDIANLGTLAVLGSIVWLWHWYRVQTWVAAEPEAERAADVRRWYLFAVLAGAVVAILVSLAFLVYRVIATMLGVAGAGLSEDISTPLAVLSVAGALLVYHGMTLRADLDARPAEADRVSTVTLRVSGIPGMSEDEVIAAVRSTAPPGFAIERR
jgi:hypothetical protein